MKQLKLTYEEAGLLEDIFYVITGFDQNSTLEEAYEISKTLADTQPILRNKVENKIATYLRDTNQ